MSAATPIPMEPMMTGQEVAAFLKVSLSMVYKLRREGRLPGVPVGCQWRFPPEIVRAFARGEVMPQPGAPVVPLGSRRLVTDVGRGQVRAAEQLF